MSNQIISEQQVDQLKRELAQWVQVTDVTIEFDTIIVRHKYDLPFVQDFLRYSYYSDLVTCQLLDAVVNNAELV